MRMVSPLYSYRFPLQVLLLVLLIVTVFLPNNNNNNNNNGIVFAHGQGLDDLAGRYDGPCAEHEDALQTCVDNAIPPINHHENGGEAWDASAFANQESSSIVAESCEQEIDNFDQCLVENGINDGLSQCRYYVRLWNTCMISWNVFLVCLSCNGIQFEETCEEFEENTCHRWNCCHQCEYYLIDYIDCVKESDQCGEEYFDCEENRPWGFWGALFFGLFVLVLVAAAAVLVVYLILKRQKKNKEKEQQQQQDEQPNAAVAAHPTTVVVNNPTTPAAANDSIPAVDGGASPTTNTTSALTATTTNRVVTGQAARMNELNKMAVDGTITQEEFDRKKNEILASL